MRIGGILGGHAAQHAIHPFGRQVGQHVGGGALGHPLQGSGGPLEVNGRHDIGLLLINHLLHRISGQLIIQRGDDLGGEPGGHGVGQAGDLTGVQGGQAVVIGRGQASGDLTGQQLQVGPAQQPRLGRRGHDGGRGDAAGQGAQAGLHAAHLPEPSGVMVKQNIVDPRHVGATQVNHLAIH